MSLGKNLDFLFAQCLMLAIKIFTHTCMVVEFSVVIGPGVGGYASIQHKVMVPKISIPESTPENKVRLPKGLKRRWRPFGYKHKNY